MGEHVGKFFYENHYIRLARALMGHAPEEK